MKQSDNLRGIVLMVTSMAFFALEDMCVKIAAKDVPIGEIILVTGLFGIPVFGWAAARSGRSIWVRGALHPAALLRAAGEMIGSFAFVTAIAAVPLPTVAAVLQAMPLAVTLGAALFLGEKVGWRRWTAIAVGFAGVLIVIRPGMTGFQPAALWVLVTVLGLALRDLASRAIPAEFDDVQVSAWGVMSLTLLGALMMGYQGRIVVPTGPQSLWLIAMVVVGTVGYWAITAATRTGEVSVVAPFRYTRLVFAIIIGGLVFAEPADVITLSGAALIIASGLYSFARERSRTRALSLTRTAG